MTAEVLTSALAHDPIPLAIRRQRVANGSRRQRDLAAVRMAEELETLEAIGQAEDEAAECWAAALQRLRASVPESTYRLWLEPLELAGAKGSVLFLAAPKGIRDWAERRYSRLIGEALEGTCFASVSFVVRESLEAA